MTLTREIIRAFFVAFGAAQTITNLTYLLRSGGLAYARKQHRELPGRVTDRQIKIKVICMLSFGALFLTAGLFAYFTRSYHAHNFIIALGAYALYALVEAIYYRFWRTFGAFVISAGLLLVVIFT